jgi:hypothetical protein
MSRGGRSSTLRLEDNLDRRLPDIEYDLNDVVDDGVEEAKVVYGPWGLEGDLVITGLMFDLVRFTLCAEAEAALRPLAGESRPLSTASTEEVAPAEEDKDSVPELATIWGVLRVWPSTWISVVRLGATFLLGLLLLILRWKKLPPGFKVVLLCDRKDLCKVKWDIFEWVPALIQFLRFPIYFNLFSDATTFFGRLDGITGFERFHCELEIDVFVGAHNDFFNGFLDGVMINPGQAHFHLSKKCDNYLKTVRCVSGQLGQAQFC